MRFSSNWDAFTDPARLAEQRRVADAWIKAKGGQIKAPPRFGKTGLGSIIAAASKTRVAVIAHQKELIQQFQIDFYKFTDLEEREKLMGRNLLSINPSVDEVDTLSVCLYTYQQFLNTWGANRLRCIRKKFGLILVDEAHRSSAGEYSSVLSRFWAKYRCGLTATPKRRDQLDFRQNLILGPVVVEGGSEQLPCDYSVSLSGLAGAVASEGGMGVISTAQIGFEEPDFVGNEEACNLRSIRKHIVRAKELASGKGMIAVNVMVALQQYREHVKEAVRAGADAVICGAGLPVDLPELAEAGKAKIAPIVSSRRAAALLLKTWDKKYGRTADFIVTEGPEAGGHLGFSREQLDDISKIRFEEELTGIMEEKKKYEEKYGKQIPVFAAGGIWDASDAKRIEALGADGVQAATRFVATKECDASSGYKKAYVNAKETDVKIIKSPVGMPGRALNNAFIQKTERAPESVERCYHCIKNCKPA